MTENSVTSPVTVGEAQAGLRLHLGDTLETDRLLCFALGCERPYLYAHQEVRIDLAQGRRLAALLRRRLQGVPLAYLTGNCEFFSLEFEVTPAVLIPRPSTEVLVEVALGAMKKRANVLDLGTGCGAIAVAIARERPDVTLTACDNDADALALARRNAKHHGVEIEFAKSDWFSRLSGRRFDVIVSNPPYVEENDPALDPEVAVHEPHTALFAQDCGLACLRRIVAAAPEHLHNQGVLALEHGYNQADSVGWSMQASGFCNLRYTRDFDNHPRVITGIRKPAPCKKNH